MYERAGIVVENGVPALINKDLFEDVQKKLKADKKAKTDYLLITKAFCGNCNYTIVGESGRGKGGIYNYYTCSNHKRFKGCDKKNVRRDWLDELIINETLKQVLNDETIDFIADRIVQIPEYEKYNDATSATLKARKKDTENSINNIIKAIEQGIFTSSTKQRLIELEELKESIEVQLLKQKIGFPDLDKEQIVFWISQFKYGDKKDLKYQKRVIDTFVNSIIVNDDEIIMAL